MATVKARQTRTFPSFMFVLFLHDGGLPLFCLEYEIRTNKYVGTTSHRALLHKFRGLRVINTFLRPIGAFLQKWGKNEVQK